MPIEPNPNAPKLSKDKWAGVKVPVTARPVGEHVAVNTLGVKESGEALEFIGALTTASVKTFADGKPTLVDLAKFGDAAVKFMPALKGADLIDDELGLTGNAGEFTASEREQLTRIFAVALELPTVDEELAVDGLDLALRLVAFINKVRARKGA